MIVAPATDREPRCGQCGYIVRGIPSTTCPECGSDLREVGIRVGREYRGTWASVGFLALIWAAALWIGAAAIVTGLEHLPPHWARMNRSVAFHAPDSKAYRVLTAQAAGTCRTDGPMTLPTLPQYTLLLTALDGSSSRLDLDFSANAYSIGGGPAVSGGSPLGAQTIAAWMKGIGIDATDKMVQSEIAAVMAKILAPPQHLSSRGSWSSSSSGTSFGSGFGHIVENHNGRSIDRTWPTAIVAVAALVAWLLGVRWMARRFGPRG